MKSEILENSDPLAILGVAPTELSKHDPPLVDTRVVAILCAITHRSLYRLLRKHQATVEEQFGQLRYEIAAVKREGARGVKYERFALLTEDQVYFLILLTRNTEPVVKFKLKLVKALGEMRRRLAEPALHSPQSFADVLEAEAIRVRNSERASAGTRPR